MKRIISLLFTLALALSLSACGNEEPYLTEFQTDQEQSEINDEDKDNDEDNDTDMKQENFNIKIKVGNKELTATLQNNATSRAFVAKLPLTLPMLDLYDREMCYRFTDALPTDNVKNRGYKVGEIVYWPPMHSFVIMYAQNGEHFDMQLLGKIDSGVETFKTTGDTDVTFSL